MKKKILVISLTICTICASFAMPGLTLAGAKLLDAADQCLVDYISTDGASQLSYVRTPLYNEELIQNGWQYDFSSGDRYGYALMTQIKLTDDEVYEIEEFKLYESSPFAVCIGMPVYITHNTYIEYRSDEYYDLATDELVVQEDLIYYAEMGFGYNNNGSGNYTEIQTISYASKATTQEYTIQYDLPNYMASSGSTNCGNVAGSCAIGYYDRFSTNLIPDYQTYRMLGPMFVYKSVSAEIGAVQSSLYNLMSTDVGQSGTTFTGFQTGMGSYSRGKGYSYSANNVLSWGSFDFEKYKTAVHAGKPVGLFMTKYSVTQSITTSGLIDTITNSTSGYAHVAMGCGYRVDTYYNNSGSVISTRIYLRAAVGLSEMANDIWYLNINGLTTINEAIAITIG